MNVLLRIFMTKKLMIYTSHIVVMVVDVPFYIQSAISFS